jgi:hypothetical protein
MIIQKPQVLVPETALDQSVIRRLEKYGSITVISLPNLS